MVSWGYGARAKGGRKHERECVGEGKTSGKEGDTRSVLVGDEELVGQPTGDPSALGTVEDQVSRDT